MAAVATYLNFMGRTEEAFEFYRSVFGTDYAAPPNRMGEIPPSPDVPPMSESDQQKIMHVTLPILGDHLLMGTDVLESMGQRLDVGNNVSIMLMPDSRDELDRLYAALSEGGSDLMPPQDMFWGDYFGACCDRFGIHWMFDIPSDT